METPIGALSSTFSKDFKKGGYSEFLFGAWVQTSQDPFPNPKAQGINPFVHQDKLQHTVWELGSY